MRPVPVLLLLGSLVASSNGRATAQAPRLTPAITARTAGALNPDRRAVAIPDSVRMKVGYQHWKGGAIGGAVGALAGLMLGLVAGHTCDDCGSHDSPALIGSLAGAGLVGSFGFLVGAATPRYRWVPREAGPSSESPD